MLFYMRGRGKKVRKNWLTSFIFMDGPTKVVFRNSFDVATAGHCKNPMLYTNTSSRVTKVVADHGSEFSD